jgi:hypothetical protein
VLLYPLDEETGILAGPEAAGVDGLKGDPLCERHDFLDEGWAVLDADRFPCLRMW